MISNITDNYFIYVSISPSNGHYHIHDSIDMLIIESLFYRVFPIFCYLLLQHLRPDENEISLTMITHTFIFTHMICKDKLTYQLSVPANINCKLKN